MQGYHVLPRELMQAVADLHGDEWNHLMADLSHERALWHDEQWSKELKSHIAKTWKMFTAAVNVASETGALRPAPLFCVCRRVMELIVQNDLCCTFTPIWDQKTVTFTPRVGYRAQGRLPGKRYREPTHTQVDKQLLERPLLAAQGAPPTTHTPKQQRRKR